MSKKKHKLSLIVLPHWHIEGGAGFYIRDLLNNLGGDVLIRVGGRYAADYTQNPVESVLLDKLSALAFPAYEGIRQISTLFHLFVSLAKMVSLLMLARSKRHVASPTAFVFTSSIQALSIPITRWLYPTSLIVIAVQEQVDLSKLFGKLILRLLRQSDVVIAITECWASHARMYGINTLVIRNQYNPSYAATVNNQVPSIESDLLYVGGGARIKGFDYLAAALPQLLKRPGIRIICLGNYSYSARKTLDRIRKGTNTGAQLNIVGHVPDIRPYLRGTKLLLLPIESPHFCRPAIEAGLFSKTFIIPDHDGIEDFSVDKINCRKYIKGDTGKLIELTFNMLDSSSELFRLGQANMRFALKYQKANEGAVSQLMKALAKNGL